MGCHILPLNCRLCKPYLGFFHTSIRTSCQANFDRDPFEKTCKINIYMFSNYCKALWQALSQLVQHIHLRRSCKPDNRTTLKRSNGDDADTDAEC